MSIINPLSELTDQLKQLKLSGMERALSARNEEATSNQCSYTEFLSLLAQDEILERQQRGYERRYRKANFKGAKTLNNFDFSFNPTINQKLVRDLATCRFIQEKVPVLIIGPCGTGKSHLAQALGHSALQQGYDVVCTTQTKLSEEMQMAKATHAYAKKLNAMAKIPLLIIDDFALKPIKSPEDENLHELIAERYEQSSTIITSNLAIDEWQQAFPNQLLGVATIDRLRHDAYQVILDGKSFRSHSNKKKK